MPPTPVQALQSAIAHHQAGRLAEAEQAYRAVLATAPGHGDANHNLGLLLAQVSGPETALPYLKRALAGTPAHPQYLLSYANALMESGRALEACTVLTRGIEAGAGTPDVRCNLGNAARQCGDLAEAERQFRTVLQSAPTHVLANYNLASLFEESGDLGQAAEHYRAALKQSPGFAEAGNNLGMVLHRLGQNDEAIAILAATLQASPGYVDAYRNLGLVLAGANRLDEAWQCMARAVALAPEDAETRFRTALLLSKLGRQDEAIVQLRQAVALGFSPAAAYNELGNIQVGLGQTEAALESFNAAVDARPDFAEAHSNLGDLLRTCGKLAEAEAACRRAIAAKPALFEAHLNLGNVLQASGDAAEALASYGRAIALRPDSAEAHYNLGNALMALERATEAVNAYAAATKYKPGFAQAYDGLGNAFKALNRAEEAVAGYRQAVTLEPGFAGAWSNLALALQGDDRVEAEACCRMALKCNPELPEALVFLAELISDQGRFDEAEQLLRRAIGIAPDMAAAWAGLAGLRKMTPADRPWLDAARALVAKGLPPRQEAHLQFAIGKYLDDTGEYADAFAGYRRANALSKSSAPQYDAPAEKRAVDQLCGAYTREFFAARRKGASDSAIPVFIVGMPRSGTSLAEQIIAAHPMAFGAGELPFWTRAAAQLAGTIPDAPQFDAALSAAAADYLRQLQDLAPQATRIVDKMPGNFRHLGLIHAAFPAARIIHMRRDPIDTCLSIYFQHFGDAHPYANDLDNLAHYYEQYERLMRHWHEVIGAQHLLEVQYEELVNDQEHGTRAMLDFIGLPWDPACLDFHEAKRTVGTASKWQGRQKMNASSVERWRRYAAFIEPLLRLQT